ncbi:hypothetical protein FJZ22_02845 [Candidatus Pacearchaeota archaeon]|nr:hypothetical protein [Candidatus Pacearchaeota archaeon]
MDPIKEAFNKVKQDIATLQHEMQQTNQQLNQINERIATLSQQIPLIQQTTTAQIPTDLYQKEVLTEQYKQVSTGNEGVPTNQQINKPTNQYTGNEGVFTQEQNPTQEKKDLTELESIVSSYQEVQKKLKHQIKTLTKQEFTVYATIYQLQLEGNTVDYPLLAQRVHLSEISAREYVLKLLKKGVPLVKTKQNNKKIILSIPLAMTQSASLPALVALYEG